MSDFEEKAFTEPAVLELAAKVSPKRDTSLASRDIEPGIVEIRMKGGEVYSRRVDYALGHPENPMSMEAIIAKFRSNATLAVKRLAGKRIDEVIEMVRNMEEVEDVAQIIRLLG